MNHEKLNHFMNWFSIELKRAKEQYPEEYAWPIEELPRMLEQWKAALGMTTVSFNNNGRAYKATCKAIGIKPTYKALNEYLEKGYK